ncbi:hypothetical protein [Actomonas aquatica]|uniref:Uncharacterized protein n=1 Tax=Actomonas aquatica TaxID=2866162 RepID=A0ABZ1C849_9BACT|nr:hypothetical protein [Opitutus sp. WL0086]WRQ87502.1 hypothetical protein K1X11_022025 [Opitutus sp. WL0086]
MAALRLPLRLLSLLLVVATVIWWVNAGAHSGWSMDQVPVTQIDEITGLEYTTYEDRFVPGMEYLVGGVALGVVLFGVSLFVKRRPTAAV